MDPINIIFNDSNLYLQNPDILQSQIGFVSPMDIDIYVKRSFSITNIQTTISWWYIQAFNKDHMIDEYFNYYKIQLNNWKAIIPSQWMIKFDLENGGLLGWWLIQSIIQSTPIISILLFTLLSFLFPAWIAIVMRYISILWILFSIVFFAYKFIKFFIKVLQSKWVEYNWVNVSFENTQDIFFIKPEYVETLKILWEDRKIQKIVLLNWEFHLKQILKRTSVRQTFKNIFIWQKIEDSQSQIKIQNTISFILSTWFISTYNEKNAWQEQS